MEKISHNYKILIITIFFHQIVFPVNAKLRIKIPF